MTQAPSVPSERGTQTAPAGSRASGWLADLAAFLPLSLLALELLLLQGRFSVAHLARLDTFWADAAGLLRDLPRVGLLAMTAVALLGHRKAPQELSRLAAAATPLAQRLGWVALQLGTFALLWAAAPPLFDPGRADAPAWPLLAGWPLLGALSLALAFRIARAFGRTVEDVFEPPEDAQGDEAAGR